jgi:hypothetical protein
VTGTVLEATDAAEYTYLRLMTADGQVWAAVTQAAVEPGAEVTVAGGTWMEGFESKTLKRRFDRILFGALAGKGAAASRPGTGGVDAMVHGAHAGVASAPADAGPIAVEKAEGGHTIAELYAAKATLRDQEVVVRGKVVKFNAGIMGRNWIHLRDGSGSSDERNDDLTVTTNDTVSVGEVVVARGKLTLDQDFGAGYSYAVLVEGAKVSR